VAKWKARVHARTTQARHDSDLGRAVRAHATRLHVALKLRSVLAYLGFPYGHPGDQHPNRMGAAIYLNACNLLHCQLCSSRS
jgi:hypothetical protein